VTTTVVQAYRFALDPTPEQDAVLRSHCVAAVPQRKRGGWRVHESTMTMTMTGKRKRDPVLHLRRVFVHSTARAQAAVTARAKNSTVPATT
jgi:hypothetical protein